MKTFTVTNEGEDRLWLLSLQDLGRVVCQLARRGISPNSL